MSYTHSPINSLLPQYVEQNTDMLALPETNFASFPSVSPFNQASIADIQSTTAPITVAVSIVKMLEDLGVEYAFGVSGGAIAPIWYTLQHSAIKLLHFRHEAGAAFAAIDAYFASGRPVVVFTTTGPGITNALTGLLAARWEDAKVIFLSASTSAPNRGRWALQETSNYAMPTAGIFTSEPMFHYATTLESSEELPEVYRRLAKGLAKPNGFVAHLSIPTNIQSHTIETALAPVNVTLTPPTASEEVISECAKWLSEGRFAIWVGFGARFAAAEIRQLAEKTGAAVMCSPRGKGIFPEDHPQFVGVTGFAGHESVLKYMQEFRPLRTLVLGTRLGEFTSFWNPAMIPSRGFLHVDIDPDVPGTAYPSAETIAIHSEIGLFVKSLLKRLPKRQTRSKTQPLPRPERSVINASQASPVRPEVLMNIMQRIIVEGSNAIVMAEGGNSFAWAINRLRFTKPGRFRVSTGFGAMGHFVTSVVGAALTHPGKAVAIVGDGAMLMNNEVSTAVNYQIPAVWIVLNDGLYNMCHQGSQMQGYKDMDVNIPQTDFVMMARSMGADGMRVERESDIQIALERAMESTKPFIVDVVIDSTRLAPIGTRISSLISQGAKK